MKAKKKSSVLEQVKAARKQSREEEIKAHGKTINYQKVMASKSNYNRKKNKADDEVLPYFFVLKRRGAPCLYQIDTLFSNGTNIASPSFIPKASYQVAICGKAPFTRHFPSECGSDLVRTRISSGRMLLAHTLA